jgi:hypothetical protein
LVVAEVVADLVRLTLVLPGVEMGRLSRGPLPLITELRARAQTAPRRPERRRARLRRLIAAVDRRMPGGANCYRRVLLETSLDRGAAEESVHIGLRAHGGLRSGHAWLGDNRDTPDRYDAEIAV